MEIICPECRADLIVNDAQTAVCTAHGGNFQVLFDRRVAPAEAPRAEVVAAAPVHFPSVKTCGVCNTANPLSATTCGVCGRSFGLLDLTARMMPPPVEQLAGVKCAQHPDVDAIARCRVCSNAMCATCEFILPGNVRACPACLEKEPETTISPKRVKMSIAGIALAAWTTFMFILMLNGSLARALGHDQGAAAVIGYMVLIPAIAGVALSLAALDRRLQNSRSIWIAVVWNSINAGFFFLLSIIGLMRK